MRLVSDKLAGALCNIRFRNVMGPSAESGDTVKGYDLVEPSAQAWGLGFQKDFADTCSIRKSPETLPARSIDGSGKPKAK